MSKCQEKAIPLPNAIKPLSRLLKKKKIEREKDLSNLINVTDRAKDCIENIIFMNLSKKVSLKSNKGIFQESYLKNITQMSSNKNNIFKYI